MVNFSEFKTYFQNKRNLIGLIVFLILILAIPLGIYLVRTTQIFAPKADVTGNVVLADGECVKTINGIKVLTCAKVPLKLTAPFNEGGTTCPVPSIAPSPSPLCSPSTSGSVKVIVDLVLDDSSSMACKSGQTDAQCKVKQLQVAVRNIKSLIRSDDVIGIQGLKKILMPINTIAVNNTKYDEVINGFRLPNGTPLLNALKLAETEVTRAAGVFPNNPKKVVILATDGCPDSGQNPKDQGQRLKALGWTVAILAIQLGTDAGKCVPYGGITGARQMMKDTASDGFFFEVDDPANIPASLKAIFSQSVCSADTGIDSPFVNLLQMVVKDAYAAGCTSNAECSGTRVCNINNICPGSAANTCQTASNCNIPTPTPTATPAATPAVSSIPSPTASVTATPTLTPSPSLSPSPSPSPSASPASCNGLISYRIAETESDLDNNSRSYVAYSQSPTFTNFELANEEPGLKQIWVEFKNNTTGQTNKEHITVSMVEQSSSSPSPSPSPSASGVCEHPSPPEGCHYEGTDTYPDCAVHLVCSSPSPSPSASSIACPVDAKVCPDGTTVGRVGPNCQFPACPPCPTPPVCPAGKILLTGDPPNQNTCPVYQCVDSPSISPTPSPSTEVGGPQDVVFRLAETEAGLASATYQIYQGPTTTNFTLGDDNPGVKQVWVEFKNNATGEIKKERITLKFIKRPKIQTADCTLDINRQDLKVTISGLDFGDGRGKIKSGQTELDILDWKNNQVSGLLEKPGLTADNGKTFQFNLTRSDNVSLEDPIICRVDTSMVALGARSFCREPGNFDVPNVKITLTDQNNNRSEETVIIAKDGTISGLKTKLQEGKPYVLSIKAPYSLRTNALFTAGVGTTFVSSEDGSPFILPVGDIAPVILQDGKINTFDRSELVRQWSVLGNNTTTRSGDFNRDTKVNSIDWACMNYDFNKEDEPLPNLTIQPPAISPLPIFSPSVSVSPSASAAVQRAAYFLPAPVGSGTYPINTEFAVDINIWSQNEAANVFNSQMSFSPAILEVVRIEKGTVLTNWTDSSFDNTLGKISLMAGFPSPGLKTIEGNDPLMAKIILKGKQSGNATITMTAQSAIYSNSDNVNIIGGLISAPVVITQ